MAADADAGNVELAPSNLMHDHRSVDIGARAL